MREHKFRSISPKTGKFVYFKIGELDENYITYGDCSFRGEYINLDIIEQYTTFKTSDKGIKIFAGDKVEFSGYGLEPPVSGIVEFKKGAWYVGKHHELYYGVENYLVKITGNIHEVTK